MIKKIAISSILIFFLTNCGFKVAETEKLLNYYIFEVTSSGDSRINYMLKNKLLQNTVGSSKKPIFINLKTVKTKTIKEKNIQNEVTKVSKVSVSLIAFFPLDLSTVYFQLGCASKGFPLALMSISSGNFTGSSDLSTGTTLPSSR